MIDPITIQGVNFFSDRPVCISHFKKAPWIKKALSLIQSFGTLFIYALKQIPLRLHLKDAQVAPYTSVPVTGFSKQKLVVCVHGLNSHPIQFKKIVEEMQKRELSETDIYIPYVLEKGNAKLDEMVQPIFQEIRKWAQTEGSKELVLVGVSNGGRVTRAIEAELMKSGNEGNIEKFRFVSIVGACKGSSLANLAHKVGLSWLVSKNIAEEMPTDSKRNAQLNQDWMDGLANTAKHRRDYTFIASPHDWQVPNYSSSLMKVPNQEARYAIVPGHGHNSIVNAAAKAVAEIVLHGHGPDC